jgi:trk system potassium uptake protein TrkA
VKVIIMGCGRVGAELAIMLEQEGHEVTVLDSEPAAFGPLGYLSEKFHGTRMVGNGIDQDALRRAGIEQADAFVSATRGDNRNVMACQIAKYVFHVPRVVSRVFDPIREEMYRSLGLRTINPTRIQARLLKEALEKEEEPVSAGPDTREETQAPSS